MKPWDKKLISRIIDAGIACFNQAHPRAAIDRRWWHSIAKRSAARIVNEHYRRFGNPVDRLVVQHVARRVMRMLANDSRGAA